MSPSTPALPFQAFFQLAYVTNDVDRALEVFAERYGVGEFRDLGEVALALDDGGEATIRIALTLVGWLELELIEPRGGRDDVYRRELTGEGFALHWHHVGFKVPSPEALDDARHDLIAGGHDVVLSGGNPSASMFFYADARETLGHHLEYIYLSPERQEFPDALPHH